ncbi:hypothetical protein EOL94_03120 [bacterium]|nr:hypothetical protein [bacterium]
MKKNHNKEKQKTFLFWSLILFIMVLILFLRIFKAPTFSPVISEEEENNSLNWQSFSEKFSSILDEFNGDWKEKNKEAKNIFLENKEDSTISESVDGKIQEEDILSDEDNNLREKKYTEENYRDIEELKNEMNNLLEEFDNYNNCPEWINCMPEVGGEPKDCTIPKGCEDITQIAY